MPHAAYRRAPTAVFSAHGRQLGRDHDGLVAIDLWVALFAVLAFGGAYLAMSVATKTSLVANSRRQAASRKALVQNVQEGLGTIRDVLLVHSQPHYLARYRDAD